MCTLQLTPAASAALPGETSVITGSPLTPASDTAQEGLETCANQTKQQSSSCGCVSPSLLFAGSALAAKPHYFCQIEGPGTPTHLDQLMHVYSASVLECINCYGLRLL
jgi:hypothetical protein